MGWMVRQHFGGWNRPWKMSYLVLNIFYAVLLLSSVSTPFSVQLLFGPYVTRIGCLSILAQPSRDVITCWKNTARRTSIIARHKVTKNHKKSKIISTTTTIICLLCCLPTNLQTFCYKSDSQIESVVLVVVLLLVCCVLWWNSILTRHSLFSPSADLIILGCKVPVSEVPSSYYCWLLFACAASACAACFSIH